MSNVRIKITDTEGYIHIYTVASRVEIDNDRVDVDYEDQHASHLLDHTDEITIKVNR